MSAILTLNAGSSSIKFSVYLKTKGEPEEVASGQIEAIGGDARLILKAAGEKTISDIGKADHKAALIAILEALKPILGDNEVTGVGHRVVHGATKFSAPLLLDEENLAELEALNHLAPLHQPHNVTGIRAAMEAFPDAIQVGCFDTAFHAGRDFVHDAYGLPRAMYDEGIRRYGFHGSSYDYVSGYVEDNYADLKDGRIVIAHLGSGSSMCAVRGRKSVATTMGFSALDGVPMGTRGGKLDPGVMLYLLEQGKTKEELTELLYKQSGILGISGISSDMRTLRDSDKPEAKQARDYVAARGAREVAALSVDLGGIDALVFTGGVGENDFEMRSMICAKLDFLGISLDEAKNQIPDREELHSGPVKILMVRTDEERVIARAVAAKMV